MEMVKYEDIKLTPRDAFNVYVERYPNTTVREVELELKSHSYVYDVKGYDQEKKYQIHVDPTDGTVIQVKETLSKGIHNEITAESTDKIQGVIDKAVQDIGGNGTIEEWSLELEDGKLELTIEMKLENEKSVKCKYDLDTGQLIKKK